ncbi:MAG: 1-(5-phosphoribosyl)-5-[(5-phosphoribosylamino)methylideneamino]imidazole-4-carboxamide isomerase [Flavobacterium sp.]|uniref:1-(5-phosphoribosyl)-5-[(5- phosphoribosylamino)methylideneamino]imidazole-4- carboxamide isomerase n=1 Tax=Flavobacterium sp. TaxID=239 RepID=UPI00121F28D3|nr:1-(5-phosphoribosyl)-5-[(5-phosphoribosylamino)methylideneamino]imidazole-4-carboxamide isomerase [Flavobacterium sp.]RZJ66238.1 MAG: 1-(5-phosphoribosyl)-5-[(5-phosphoribosylamino)methylideneamino]imidazole-4-carboxamide isomerase [Flavobacterium sp.]
MRIIPAIDIIDGKCVRLSQGDFSTSKTYGKPLEMAKLFEDNGLRFLHLVDLDGARLGKIANAKVLEEIASGTSLQIDFGGGIKTTRDVRQAFDSGASQVTAGSIAVHDAELVREWFADFGTDRIILGADCSNRKIATNGWKNTTDIDIFEFVAAFAKQDPISIICTDIASDGMLNGPAFDLYRDLLAMKNLGVIASGGVSSLRDLLELKRLGCEGAIVGKAIYENRITLTELSKLC